MKKTKAEPRTVPAKGIRRPVITAPISNILFSYVTLRHDKNKSGTVGPGNNLLVLDY
jgi:hypothetical protein